MLVWGGKQPEEGLKTQCQEVRKGESRAQVTDCLGWEEQHLPGEGGEERRLSVGWGLEKG